MSSHLPHINAGLNLLVLCLLLAGYAAIRRGHRSLHPKLMLSTVAVGCLFLASYVLQVALVGHQRFPGDDWVRSAFLLVLGSHTLLAAIVAPMILRTLYLGLKGRFDTHKPWARLTFALWLYVATTGVAIYWMNHHLRPLH